MTPPAAPHDRVVPAAGLSRPARRAALRSLAIALGMVLAVTAVDVATHWTPSKERAHIAEQVADLNARQPEVVLLGNSLLGEGVDAAALEAETGRRVEKMAFYGHASALWYLVMHNVVARVAPAPRVVAILFQRDLLTQPGMNVTGGYRRQIEKWMRPEGEPVLDRLAYRAQMNVLDYYVLRYWRLYDERDRMKSKIEDGLKWVAARLCRAGKNGGANAAIDRVFANENMNRELLTARQRQDAQAKEAAREPFADVVGRSFLPEMVAMSRERGFQLVFVWMQPRPGAEVAAEKKAWKDRYAADLRAWLAEQRVGLIDFTADERLTIEDYADGDHLNPTLGKPLFTRMLAEALGPYLGEAVPAREGGALP